MKKSTIEKIKKDTRGAISILLACLMLPFFSLSAMLIEMGRYQSAVNALDSALGNSAYSTLAGYDSYVFERFGLLAAAQSTEDTNADLTSTVEKYLGLQKTIDMRGVEIEELTAQGLNSLAEIEILKQQIQNYAAVLGPTKLLVEGLEINSIIKQLEEALGFANILKAISAGIDTASKGVATLEAYDDARKQMKEVQKAETEYDDAFEAWCDAVQDLIDHLGTECPDKGEDEKGYNKWQEEKAELQTEANTQKSEYASAISSLISQFQSLQENINSAITAKSAFESQVVTTVTASYTAQKDENMPEEPSNELKTTVQNYQKAASAVDSGAKAANAKVNEHTKGLSADRIEAAVTALNNEKTAVNSYSVSGVTASSSVPGSAKYHSADLEGLTDEDAIDELFEETEDEIKDSGGLDTLLAIFDILNALFKTELVADGRLNTVLNTSYYKTEIGGLPSTVSTTPKYSFLAEDERRSMEYLETIDPDYDPDDPYGFSNNTLQRKFDAFLTSVNDLIDSFDDLEDADWLLDKLAAVVDVGVAVLDVITKILDCLVTLVAELASAIASLIYERILTFSYLAYNLPNRTNFSTGMTLSGYSFAKISRPAVDTATNIPIVGDIWGVMNQSEEYSFVGAELEYIIWGEQSEIKNQSNQFFAIFFLRLLLDLPQVVANTEVQSIMNTLNVVPYIGPVLGIGFVVLAVLTEPFLDTVFLVNGADAEIIKKTVYITPSGIPQLISNFSSIAMTKASQKKITEKACKAYKISIEEANKKAETTKSIFDKDKYVKKLLAFDYTEHSLLLMLLFGNEKTYLKRLADLIQCEMTMRNRVDKSTITNQVTEDYTDFNIYQAYSTIRVQAKGKVKQLLPLPKLSDVNVFDRTLNRIVYRGY